jgi:hypothetical protein
MIHLIAQSRSHLDDIPGLDKLYELFQDDKINDLILSDNPMREIIRVVSESLNEINHDPAMLDAIEAATYIVFEKKFLEVINHSKDVIKLCSFCATMKHITMWSHYANHHKGFCIEYDIEKIQHGDMGRRMLFPVIYSDAMFDCTKFLAPTVKDLSNFNNLYPILQAIYKSPEWKYEMEWRLVFIAGVIRAESDYPMPSTSRVFLGARISDKDRVKVLSVCQSKRIECYQMSLRHNRFELESQLIS